MASTSNRAQKDEVSELGMNQVAVNPDFAETCRGGHRFVRYNPELAGKIIHLHRESHRRIHRPYSLPFQFPNDPARNLVDLVSGVVKLEIRDRAGAAADRFAIHANDETDQRSRVREVAEDVVSLVRDFRPTDFNETHVVGPELQAQVPQGADIELLRICLFVLSGVFRLMQFYRGVFG